MAWGLLGGDMLRKATVDTTNALTFQGNSNAPTSGGVTDGLTASGFYNNSNTPCSYSNVINIKGDKGGCSQLALGWSGSNNGIEHLYYRNKRDCCDTWSEWRTVAFTTDTVANANYASVAGAVTFDTIGDVAVSNKITWNGSTDGADIYYQTTAADQGNLVINLRDDNNCYLRIAQNGNYKSYFSPADGNFHGNVNGTADYANAASKVCNANNSNEKMAFHWEGQEGEPMWLWGGNSVGNMYVYHPYNLNVNSAKSAGSVNGLTFTTSASDPGAGSNLTTNQVLFVYE